jgi:hypothetical protein
VSAAAAAGIPEPTPAVVRLPAYPSPVSRTQTEADAAARRLEEHRAAAAVQE